MSKYEIREPDLSGKVWIADNESGKVFNGYDFMGSIIWEDFGGDAYWMDPDEAEAILSDLEASDEPVTAKSVTVDEDALMIILQAAQEHLDSLNAHGCVDKDLEDAIRALTATIDY